MDLLHLYLNKCLYANFAISTIYVYTIEDLGKIHAVFTKRYEERRVLVDHFSF